MLLDLYEGQIIALLGYNGVGKIIIMFMFIGIFVYVIKKKLIFEIQMYY